MQVLEVRRVPTLRSGIMKEVERMERAAGRQKASRKVSALLKRLRYHELI